MVRDFYSRDGRRQAFIFPRPFFWFPEDVDEDARIEWHVAIPNGRENEVLVFDSEEEAVGYIMFRFPDIREVVNG